MGKISLQCRLILAVLGMFCMLSGSDAHGQASYTAKSKTPATKKKGFLQRYTHPYQSNYFFSAAVGWGACSGDIAPLGESRLHYSYMNPGVGVGVGYRLTNFVSVVWDNQYQLLRGRAADGYWGGWAYRTHLFSSAVLLRVNIKSKTNLENEHRKFEPYLLAGVGVAHWRTKVLVDSAVYERFRPELRTPSARIAAVFPVGVGTAWHLNDQTNLALELLYQFTTTDFLDGASLIDDRNPRADHYIKLQVRITRQPFHFFRYGKYLNRK